jgi:predicted DNA-binding transcriptional regulator AlpA
MRYLSFRDLRAKLGGRGRTTIYRDVKEGRLPNPVKLGSRLYWNECEIDEALTKGLETKARPEIAQ